MRKLHSAILIILLLVLACSAGYAADTGAPPEAAAKAKEDDRLAIHKQDQWQFFFSPYLWVPGVNINTTILGHTATVSQGWWDMIPKLFSSAFGGMGRFEAWRGKWGFFVDGYFLYIDGNVSDGAGGSLDYITRAGNVDFGPRYLLGTVNLSADKPLPVLSFEVLGGGRINVYSQYLKLNLDATLTGPAQIRTPGGSFVSKFERAFIEPMLGMRLGLWLTPKAVVTFRGTVGGFGFADDNNLDSDMELSFGYKVHNKIYAYAGYRARFESADKDVISLSGWFHGPVLGAVFTF